MTQEQKIDALIGKAYEAASEIEDSKSEYIMKNGVARIAHMNRGGKKLAGMDGKSNNIDESDSRYIKKMYNNAKEGMAMMFDYQDQVDLEDDQEHVEDTMSYATDMFHFLRDLYKKTL